MLSLKYPGFVFFASWFELVVIGMGTYSTSAAALDSCAQAHSPIQIAEQALPMIEAMPTDFDVEREERDRLWFQIAQGLINIGELAPAEAILSQVSATMLRAELLAYLGQAKAVRRQLGQAQAHLHESLALMNKRTTQERVGFFKKAVEAYALGGYREGFKRYEQALLALSPIKDYQGSPPLDRNPEWFGQVSAWLIKGGLMQDAKERLDISMYLLGVTPGERSQRTALLAQTAFEFRELGDDRLARLSIDKITHPHERALTWLRLFRSSNPEPRLLEAAAVELDKVAGISWDPRLLETALGEIIVEQARNSDLAGVRATAKKIKHQILDYELQTSDRLKIELATLQALFTVATLLKNDNSKLLEQARFNLLDSIVERELICKDGFYKCHGLGKLVAILAVYDRTRLRRMIEGLDYNARLMALAAGVRKLKESQPPPGLGYGVRSHTGLDIMLTESLRLEGLMAMDHLVTEFSLGKRIPDTTLEVYTSDRSKPHEPLLQRIHQFPPRISDLLKAVTKLSEAGFEQRAVALWQASLVHIERGRMAEKIDAIPVALEIGDRAWAESRWKLTLSWINSKPRDASSSVIAERLVHAAIALDNLSAIPNITWTPELKRLQLRAAIALFKELMNSEEIHIDNSVRTWLQGSLPVPEIQMAMYDAILGNFTAAESLLAGQISRRNASLLHEAIVNGQIRAGSLNDAVEYLGSAPDRSISKSVRMHLITELAIRGFTAEAVALLAKERHWNSLASATLAAYQADQVETGDALVQDLIRRMRATRFAHYSNNFREALALVRLLVDLKSNESATSLLTEIYRQSAMLSERSGPQTDSLLAMRKMNTDMLIANGALEQALEIILQQSKDFRRDYKLRALIDAALDRGDIDLAAKAVRNISEIRIALESSFDVAAASPDSVTARQLASSAIAQAGESGCMFYVVGAAKSAGMLALEKSWGDMMQETGAPWPTWVSGLASLARGQFIADRPDEARGTLARAAGTLSARHLPTGVSARPQVEARNSCSLNVRYRWEAAFPGFRPGIDLLEVATKYGDSQNKKAAIQAVEAEASAAMTEAGLDKVIPLILEDYGEIPSLSAGDRIILGRQLSNIMQATTARVLFHQGDPATACKIRDAIQHEPTRTRILVDFLGGEGPKWQR